RLRQAEAPDERTAPAGQVYAIDPAAVAAAAGVDGVEAAELLAGYLLATTENAAPVEGLTAFPRPETTPGSHLSYAFQWWVFACGALVGYVVLARREARELSGYPAERPRLRPRRRSDAEEEAALIDAQLRDGWAASLPAPATDQPPPGADVDDSVRAGTTSAEVTRRAVATRSGQRDELGVVVAPQVLVAVGQEEHPLGLERLDGALVVRDEDDGSGVGAQRGEDLLPRGGVEVVRRFVEQEDVGRGDDEHRERQPGLLPAGEHLRRLVGVVPGEEEGAEHRPHLGVGEVRGGGAQVLHHGPVDVEGLVLLGVVADLQPVAGHDRTGVRLLDAGEDAQQGRLARAVEPQHDDLRAAVDGEVDVGEHLQRAVGL